ncbi:hypothetical protein D7316_02670 [Gordonia insulae]|uniref:Ig-like domain-containing protein n=1 Tax=Gordonia insulae TaxID=2420509 RepID=A0A3G8JPI4_9ACTN|nr:hypothetical protein D7316_02670 [Gordonia insulae]
MRGARTAVAIGGAVAGLVITVIAGPGEAAAAPVGKVDAGVPFSSVVYGSGCRYDLTVPVDATGRVTFWEREQGGPERFIGAAPADGAIATIRWVPRDPGDRQLYAKQGGVTGPKVLMRVHQGYGSGWACFAL